MNTTNPSTRTPSPRSPRASKRSRRGYTAVEVVIAMTLFAIGGAGIIAMERAAVRGSQDARALDVASGIGREWLERIRRDALLWGVLDPSAANAPILIGSAKMTWLKAPEVVVGAVAPSPWRVPPAAPNTPGARPTFDTLGREVNVGSPDVKYCVQYRIEAVQFEPGGATLAEATTLRVDIRVLWSRGMQQGPVATFCADQIQDAQTVQSVVISSVVRRNNQ
ncbi:MAG: prepilin-type N-terminal cleavage/methylation domain-containing protein [Myxococcales bacterium]|jgi:prepilin-type N-terminal cleavage/methylation domain-containing protein|nr:prepilin-type N-terminal cleavage/methylation domain-containing protein [Myxococcales bacterium]